MLRELQRELGRAFLEPRSAGREPSAADERPSAADAEPSAADEEPRAAQEEPRAAGASPLSALRPMAQLSAAESLDIYRSAVENALRDSLRDIFPVCLALVGDDCFLEIARRYARVRDAGHPDLARSGRGLPAFIPELSFLASVPYLADVARLELAWHEAFTAPAPPSTPDPDRIADAVSHAPDRWRFDLTPSATLIRSPHPVLAIWEAHERAAEEDGELELEQGDERGEDRLIVWRRGSDLCIHRVTEAHWPLACAIEEGRSVAELLTLGEPLGVGDIAALGEDSPEDYAPILKAIGELFELGWIAGVKSLDGSHEAQAQARASQR